MNIFIVFASIGFLMLSSAFFHLVLMTILFKKAIMLENNREKNLLYAVTIALFPLTASAFYMSLLWIIMVILGYGMAS